MRLRRAVAEDAPIVWELLTHESAAAYLRVREDGVDGLRAELAAGDPAQGERLLIGGEDGGVAGTLAWRLISRRSRIAELSEVVVAPHARGAGLALAAVRAVCGRLFDEERIHRVQLETFGDNAAGRRTFSAAGFVEEGVRRRAYWRREAWQDGVLFGLLADEADRGG